jgi:hypothetical protein
LESFIHSGEEELIRNFSMRYSKNLLLLFSLIILLVLLLSLLFIDSGSDKQTVDKNLFKVENQAEIDHVLLEAKEEKVDLKFNGSKWIVNDSFEADNQLIKVLFATFLQAEPHRPVAKRMIDSIQQDFKDRGINVILFDQDKTVKMFSVVGNLRETETYYQLDGSDQPYLVTIPGYRVFIAGIFQLGALDWRERRIFNFNWQNFKSLKTFFADNLSGNFSISFQNRFFGLDGELKADTTKLNNYLDAVSLIQAMKYIPEKDTVNYASQLNTTPSYLIEVLDIANHSYKLEVFNAPNQGGPILARYNDQLLFLNPEDEQLIRVKKSYFLK